MAFRQGAERLRELLGEELAVVHHIGSTSVPGLAAKPIIDILPVVSHIGRVDGFTQIFQEAGYRAWGEYGLPRRRFFTNDHEGTRTHNLHIYETGDPSIERHLAFCAYLRHDGETRDEYEALKRQVYAHHPADIMAYNDAKDSWIKRIEQVAARWYRRQIGQREDEGTRPHPWIA